MKKTLAIFLTALLAVGFSAAVFAQDGEPQLKISGEAKSGIDWRKSQDEGKPVTPDNTPVRLHSRDDAGGNQGRVRINMDYDNGNGFGVRFRIQWENFNDDRVPWSYGFGYGNFFEDQLTVSVGKLGASPWGTGGDLWKQLETELHGGIRIEYKPAWVPEDAGRFNVGFVLNWIDDVNEAEQATVVPTLWDILQESVIGVSYTHDLFHARVGYRLDSDLDNTLRVSGKEGGKLIYRMEEYMLNDLVPGLSMWAVGYYKGVGASSPDYYDFQNQMFARYAPPDLFNLQTPFTAEFRVGYDYVDSRSILHLKPSLYWHFFDKLLSVGAYFLWGQDFGNKVFEGSPYLYIELEPKVQLNFSSSYIALVYNWRQMYIDGNYTERKGADPIRQTQFINLRFCIYF